MANRYIRLISSGSSLDFKFKAVQWKPIYQKAQQVERTIGGGIDVHTGAVQQTYRYILRVSYDYQEGEEDFGRYSELIKFYALNNPNAVDSNLLTFFIERPVSFPQELDPHGSVDEHHLRRLGRAASAEPSDDAAAVRLP